MCKQFVTFSRSHSLLSEWIEIVVSLNLLIASLSHSLSSEIFIFPHKLPRNKSIVIKLQLYNTMYYVKKYHLIKFQHF